MRRSRVLVLVLAMLMLAVPGTTVAAEPPSASSGGGAPAAEQGRGHTKKQPPIVEKWLGDKRAAADLVARGRVEPNSEGVVTLPNGTPVDYALEDTEHLTVVLMDFADLTHGNIPEPDRSVDNSTYWTDDFSPQHYADMLFSEGGSDYGFASMRDYYLEQSSGRFTWEGQVSNWVQSTDPAAEYGANHPASGAGGDDLNGPTYRVVNAALQALAASGNYGGLDLTQVDQIDRYDCDGDANFNEPDGYFDHFGLVHAGEGEEAGASPDTIWSHRWYANFNDDEGPAGCLLGGYQLPGTNLWVGDYTTEPENGAVGVFAHEFGHDLGLPDLYDTAGGENGTGFWTLMSSGSWASYAEDSIDTAPVHMGAWEKLVLGWLDLGVAELGDDAVFELGPAEHATEGRHQALRVNLPDQMVTTTEFAPIRGDTEYYFSGRGNDIDNSMTKALPAALPSATPIGFKANWSIETDWDYAYLLAQVGGEWQEVETSVSTTTSPNGQNFGFGITGTSHGRFRNVNATLPAGTTAIGFRYWTDGAVVGAGFAVDQIQVGSGAVDTASETDAAAWTFDGFQRLVNGEYTQAYFHYYLVESRSYIGNDRSLCGAYNFTVGNWVEKNCYADGLLVSYRNSFYADNDTALHPGGGQILPVDSHPEARIQPDGKTPWRQRWQTWDATFGVDSNSVLLTGWVQKRNAGWVTQEYVADPVSTFYDSSTTAYWNPAIPLNSVKTAGSGLTIDITGVSEDRGSYQVHVYQQTP